jgi:hypothetical protein
MSSKNKTKLEEKSKVTRCTNCRQDISSEKMFLHEGFCHRNNKFCEHCDKVFLKEDYEKHIKKISAKNINEKTDKNIKNEIDIEETKKAIQITQNKNENVNNIKEEIATVVKKSVTTVNPESVEYLHMPLTKEITTISKPIIISPNGQIVSNKNKNDYLLPYLGINLIQNNYNNNYNLNGFNMFSTDPNNYYDKDDFLNIGNQNNLTDIQNSFNLKDIDTNKIFQTEANIDTRNNYDFITHGELFINENNNNNNDYNLYQINNQINSSNDYRIFDGNESNNNLYSTNDLNNIYKNNSTEFNFINKNINNEKMDFYKNQNKNKKKYLKVNTKIVKKVFTNKNQSNKKNFKIPLDKNRSRNKDMNMNHNKNVKEPTDNNSKINIKSKISLMKQNKNKNTQRQPMNKISKKKGYRRDVKDSKRKNSSLDENLFQNIDENGIDEMKKKVLQRELMPNKHFISFNNDRIQTHRNFYINNNNGLNSGDSKRFNYRKKLIQEANANLNQQELFSKTQGRYFKNKKKEIIIRLNDNSLGHQNNKIIKNFEQSPINLTAKGNKKRVFYSESRNIQKNKNIFIDPNSNERKNSLYK